jgi:hypothetical protein
MKKLTAALMVALAPIALTAMLSAQNRFSDRFSNRSSSINIDHDHAVTDCGDIRVSFGQRPAITEEAVVPLPASQPLKAQMSKGGIFINGWDRNEYSAKVCKAVADDNPNSTSTLRDITATNTGNGPLTVTGPADDNWTANLIIMVPRLTNMEIETRNGPLQLQDLAGSIRLNTTNGPISLSNVGGVVETTATNGPIALRGISGDQRVNANNGPISLELSGNRWDGPGLQVSTRNGPLSVSIPDGYGSGIQIQTSDHSPVNCAATACAGATRTLTSPTVIRLGSGDPLVRLSTSNGPLSIQQARR